MRKSKESRTKHYLKNRERILRKKKEWYNKNRAKARLCQARYKAAKRNSVPENFDLDTWIESQKPFRCYLCGKKIKNEKFHIEHKIPLSRGGIHASINLGIACPTCNLAKNTKTPWEYLPDRFRPELMLAIST